MKKHVKRLWEEFNREREERNYFQLERDKINTFLKITKRQVDNLYAQLRNKDREMEDVEERHQIEIKVYKQKVKHLLYKHEQATAELRAENVVALNRSSEQHRSSESELRGKKRSLKLSFREHQLSNENVVKSLTSREG